MTADGHDKKQNLSGEQICVGGAPTQCACCGDSLCLRQQVINLALGKVESMACLSCLGKENDQEPLEVLSGIKSYVLGRECFGKEWAKYPTVEFCPNRDGCFPDACFSV